VDQTNDSNYLIFSIKLNIVSKLKKLLKSARQSPPAALCYSRESLQV